MAAFKSLAFKSLIIPTTLLLLAGAAHAAPVDLSTWEPDLYTGPNQASGGGANWVVQGPDNDSVLQTANGQPTTFFEAGSNAQGTSLAGQITVESGGDDDFIGFVLGYQDDEINQAVSDFYLIDWKGGNQNLGGVFGNAPAGLAISHVTAPDGAAFWGHDNASAGTVDEIARATTLGATGWVVGTTYEFDLVFTPQVIQVFVDSVLELDVTAADFGLASFDDGAFGFYNYSQGGVRYAGITEDVVVDPCLIDPTLPECDDDGAVPAPGALALMALGLGGMAITRRRRRR